MSKRSVANKAASVRQRLLNLAKASGRPFSEILQHYALERWLYRLSRSENVDHFVLKGALLLRVWASPLVGRNGLQWRCPAHLACLKATESRCRSRCEGAKGGKARTRKVPHSRSFAFIRGFLLALPAVNPVIGRLRRAAGGGGRRLGGRVRGCRGNPPPPRRLRATCGNRVRGRADTSPARP